MGVWASAELLAVVEAEAVDGVEVCEAPAVAV